VTVTRGVALFLPFVLFAALGENSGALAAAPLVAGARLTAISSRIGATSTSLLIEATAPVPYVTTRLDSLTVLLDFRNVAADGIANAVAMNAQSPISAVSVEAIESLGAPVSRVRISLAKPLAYHVRSERNTVVVRFDQPVATLVPTVAAPTRNASDLNAAIARIYTPAVDPIAALGLSRTRPAARQAQAVAPSQPPQAASPTERAPGPGGGRQYVGNPVSLDFQQADLRAVLRVFSEISGLNIVIDPTVQGTVDVALRDVPWDQALDIILRANKLGYIVDGTIVRIAPLSALADEESQRRKLADEQALSGDLRVFTKTLSYARAEEMLVLLKSTLSQRGTVQIDPRTNTMIITDLQDRLNTAADLITALDRAQPQVEIEARIVQTTKDYARALGIQWGFRGRANSALGNTTNLAFPNNGSLAGAAAGGAPSPGAIAAAGATSALGLSLGSVNGAFNLDVALDALESSGDARVLSNPRITTQNNVAAEIKQGVQVPFQTTANNTVTTSFIDAALSLKVTPQITADNTVILKITVDNGSLGPQVGVAGPSINTQFANTTVQVDDGQTTVLGGIYTSSGRSSSDRTPGISRVPLLNWLFRRETENSQIIELLLFITPRIIKG
jgi:type IV pilus assembly protein PilQ